MRKFQRFPLSIGYGGKPFAVTEPQLKSCQNVHHQVSLKSCMIDCSFSRANLFKLIRFRTSCMAAAAGIYFSLCSSKDFVVCTFKLFSELQKPLKILHLGKQRKGMSVGKRVFF